MKEISLCKAKLDDLEMYKKFYEDYDAQFLYSNHDEDDYEKSQEAIEFMGINMEMLKNEDVSKDYKDNLKKIYFITVNQIMVGYIKADKKGKELTIHDMAISDYSILNEMNLYRLFNTVFTKTKTEKIVIYSCTENNSKMLQRIGFQKKQGQLEKTAGI